MWHVLISVESIDRILHFMIYHVLQLYIIASCMSSCQINTEWNTSKRQEVLDLAHHMHLRPWVIKELTDVLTPTIRHILHTNEPHHDQKPQMRWPSALTPWDIWALIRAIIKGSEGRRASYTVIVKKLEIVTSESTLHKYLCQERIWHCIACKKSLVSKNNYCKQLKWAREHLHWEIEDWLRIIFTDETIYETGQKELIWVSQRPEECYCSDCASNIKHIDRESVMTWGDFCGNQCSNLVKFKKTLKIQKHGKNKEQMMKSIMSQNYMKQILEGHLKHWYEGLKDQEYHSIFMQDNAPIHNNALICVWFRKNNIEVLNWSPQSSDLNSDEYMWNWSKQKIKSYLRLIFTSDKMFKAAYHEWHALTDCNTQLKWVEKMHNQCQAVIDTHSESTKY